MSPGRALALAVLAVAPGCADAVSDGRGAASPQASVVFIPRPPAAPSAAQPAAPPTSQPSPPGAPTFAVTPEGELETPGEITFGVRPLSGPGSMGPPVLSPASEAALSHVSKYLEAHPDQRVRVECAVNVLRTSSGPNPRYAAHLAHLVARGLVDHGTPCSRVEAVGRLVKGEDAPVHQVRFLVRWGSEPPDGREDPCRAP